MLTHVVFFKLHKRTPENAQTLREALLSLAGKIPQIKHMEVGINVVPSERAFDVALFQRFDSVADLQAYQAHRSSRSAEVHLAVTSSRASVDYEGHDSP
jgi:hypothetical protein